MIFVVVVAVFVAHVSEGCINNFKKKKKKKKVKYLSPMLEGEGSIPVRDVGFPPLICDTDLLSGFFSGYSGLLPASLVVLATCTRRRIRRDQLQF